MKWKRTDGESAKVVREQVFLLSYKSESGIVESSVCTSSAHYQHCHSDLFQWPMGAKTTWIKSATPDLRLKAENTLTVFEKCDIFYYYFFSVFVSVFLSVFEPKQVCTILRKRRRKERMYNNSLAPPRERICPPVREQISELNCM